MLWETLTVARDVGRLHEIASVLMRFGFADALTRVGLAGALAKAGRVLHAPQLEAQAQLPSPVRLRQALEDLGPTFVKLGQVLASRVDLFAPEWIAEFERLQNHAPFVPFEEIEAVLEAEFGAPLRATLGALEPTPLAAASIAQVHRATLCDGSQVVVKVRRPGIRETIAADLRLLERLARVLEARSPEAARYRPREVVRHFRNSIERELDLAAECHHAERIAAALPLPALVVPRVHWQWTCEAINVQDFVPGRPLQELLDPDFDMVGAARPFLARVLRERYSPRSLARQFRHAVVEAADSLSLMPHQLQKLLRAMADGRARLRMDLEQLPEFGEQIAHSANRLALGLIISALIVGSSIVMTVNGGEGLFGLQFFGMAGFIAAVAGGIWLLVSILRSGGGR